MFGQKKNLKPAKVRLCVLEAGFTTKTGILPFFTFKFHNTHVGVLVVPRIVLIVLIVYLVLMHAQRRMQ